MRRLKIFTEVVRALNEEFGVTPILYGSFGLEQVLQTDFNAQDIDILIADDILKKNWDKLICVMSAIGFVLDDPKEREFVRGVERIAFAPESDLIKLAGFTSDMLKSSQLSGAKYKELNAPQYLTLYESLRDDPYRRKMGKTQKDEKKIEAIKNFLK